LSERRLPTARSSSRPRDKAGPLLGLGGTGVALFVPSRTAACLQGVWRQLCLRCRRAAHLVATAFSG
jgi:hypothetical protein